MIIIAFFHSLEVPGGVPALWCYESMSFTKVVVICAEALLQAEVEGRRVWLPGEATETGHLLLPIDNWDPATASELVS